MYPSFPMGGSMAPRTTPPARPTGQSPNEPDEDDMMPVGSDSRGMPMDQMGASGTGGGGMDQMGPPNPAMQFAGMSPSEMMGGPGQLQQNTPPPMGGSMGVGSDMALNQARAEFTMLINNVQGLVQNYPMAAQQLTMATQALMEAMLMVGQAVQQPPVPPEIGP